MAPTNALQVDASNVDQLHAWDGDEGAYWAAHADYFDRSASPYHEKLMAAAAIALTDRVLDIGCGAGQTTRDAGRAATAGSALGVDLSSRMIDTARRRATAEGVTNAFFEQADAQIHPFEAGAFDVAISRSAAMFFGDQAAAFSNIARALRPHGRLVLTTWQSLADNEWVREIIGRARCREGDACSASERARSVRSERPRPNPGRPHERWVHQRRARGNESRNVVRQRRQRRVRVRARPDELDGPRPRRRHPTAGTRRLTLDPERTQQRPRGRVRVRGLDNPGDTNVTGIELSPSTAPVGATRTTQANCQ